jgi:hypothetical protein
VGTDGVAEHNGGVDIRTVAAELIDRAVTHEHSVLRCDASTPVAALRGEVRRQARERQVRIRTGMVDDVLTVIRADAALWGEPVSVMRGKLKAPPECNTVG